MDARTETAATIKHQIKTLGGAVLFEAELSGERGALFDHLLGACEVSDTGCVEWRFAKTNGAGRPKIAGRKVYAHRAMYEAVYGPIPDGLLVRHDCDNRACIRPDHLILGTQADNMADMAARGRSTKGRALSLEHRLKLSKAGRGKAKPERVKQAIAASVRAYHARHADIWAPAKEFT